MKNILLLLALNAFWLDVWSQTCDWAVQFHKSHKTNGINVQVDENKNVYVAGNYSSDNNHVIPVVGFYLRKYNSQGTIMWSQTYDSMNVRDMGVDSKNNIYLSLYTWPNVKFNNITSSDYQCLYSKVDSNGNFKFTELIKSNNVGNVSLTVDKNDNIYLCGIFNDTLAFPCKTLSNPASPGSRGMFLAKFNSNNQCLWAKQTQGGSIVKYNTDPLLFDKEGNFHVYGQNFGTTSFDANTTIIAKGADNTFIAKYSPEGNVLWVKNFGSATVGGEEELKSITCDKYGNVWASGTYDSDLSIDGFYLPNSNTYFPKPFFAKLDKNGLCTSVTSDKDVYKIIKGKYYKTGGVNTSGTYNNVSLQPGFYIMYCDTNWQGLWAYQPPIFGNFFNNDSDNNLYLTGSFSGTADFGNGKVITGNMDMFAVNYSPAATVGLIKNPSNTSLKITIHPNPTSGMLVITGTEIKTAFVNIKNILGQNVYSKNISSNNSELSQNLDISTYPKGIYFIEVNTDKGKEVKKVVLE